ncbi:MAG: EAL domain-containing protein [Lachnospiraceae bacterium]
MREKNQILIVDDKEINRNILKRMLEENYQVSEAKNGEEAIQLLETEELTFSGILLDLIMPVMDGYEFLEKIGEKEDYKGIPIIVITENDDKENEIRALELGAWDFVSKPYDAQIICFRLQNAIQRSKIVELQEVEEKLKYDPLTGIYNKETFFYKTKEMIRSNASLKFVLIRADIDRFQLINSFFGVMEGDNLLKYISINLWRMLQEYDLCTFGRVEADVFCCCVPYEKAKLEGVLLKGRKILEAYNRNYDIVPSVGLFILDDSQISIQSAYDKASMAAKKCKGNCITFFTYYDEELNRQILMEHEITNEMNIALIEEQFTVYLQPKVNLFTQEPEGAEALVRWIHPDKGVVSPGDFVPIFERNGFIMKLDSYIWEKVCKLLRRWIDEGRNPKPISVNLSRVNFYNPNICNTIIYLVEKYNIPTYLLQLELTESAYTDNPTTMKTVMSRLQAYGFTVLMDDFGSGYSSLNMLKDINVDILKLDMRFLENSEIAGRGENILTSIVRMAKWLNIPVVVEGVETKEQTDFLKSLGCDYAQGYYYARPMEIEKYESFMENHFVHKEDKGTTGRISDMKVDEFWTTNSQVNLLFNSIINAVGIYEVYQDKIELIRANDGFFEVTHDTDESFRKVAKDVIQVVVEEDRLLVKQTFKQAVDNKNPTTCVYRRYTEGGDILYIQIKIKHIMSSGEHHLFYGAFNDITCERKALEELKLRDQYLEKQVLMLQVALEHSSIQVWEYDILKKQCIQQPKAQTLCGVPEIIENAPWSVLEAGLIDASSQEEYLRIHTEVMNGNPKSEGDISFLLPEGKKSWMHVTYHTIFDENNRPITAIGYSKPN